MKKKLVMVMCLFMTLAFVGCTDNAEDLTPLVEEKATNGGADDPIIEKPGGSLTGGEANTDDRKSRPGGNLGG